MGMAPRHVSCENHTFVSQNTQPLDRHCVSAVRCTLGTSVQMHHCYHRCFQDRLGRCVQRECSFRGLDRPPAALAHQLPGVVGSASSPEEVPTFDSGQACVGPVRQHSDCGLHQPPGRCTLLSHVTTSLPSPAVEPTQTQVSACHSHSGRSQSHGRFSVTTGFTRRRVEAPPPIGPTDLGSIRPGTSRSLCLTGIHPLPVVVWSNRGSPRYRCTGTQLAEGPAQVCVSPSEPHCTDSVQSQGGQGTDSLGSPLLAQQNLVLGPGAPGISSSLAHSSEEGPPFSGEGHNLAPVPRSLKPPPMVLGRDQEDFRDLSPSVVNTLLQARAPTTRRLYDLKWCIFVNWCSSRGKDPWRCGIESVLSFLQGGLDRHLSASTLKIRTSEQKHTLPYLYPDVRGVAGYAKSAHPISLASLKTKKLKQVQHTLGALGVSGTALQRWSFSRVEWVAHIRLHYPPVCVADSDLPSVPQHVKRATLKEHSRVERLFKGDVAFVPTQRCVVTKMTLRRGIDAFLPVRLWMRSLSGAGTPQPLELPKEWAGPSRGVPLISFGVPPTTGCRSLHQKVHQAKALKDLHEGGHNPEVLREFCTASDLVLRATKVTAWSLGCAMSTMVVQERHLWLCLVDMRETDKTRFLNSPMSQTVLFGDAVEIFAQQFSAAQKLTEAVKHILPRRAAATSTQWQHLSHAASWSQAGGPGGEAFVPKILTIERFPLSLGPQGGRGVLDRPIPPLSPLSSSEWFESAIKHTTHAASARTQVSVAYTQDTDTQTPLRTGYETPERGPCVPLCCPTAGMSVVPLVPLVWFLGAWLALTSPSCWLLQTIRLGYATRFAHHTPKFRGVHFTSVEAADAPVLSAEIATLLAKDAIQPAPPADMKAGFYSLYFVVPMKGGGLRPILDLRVLNQALHRLPFKMLTQKHTFRCVHPQDRFAATDLKDMYFHASIFPCHRPFLRFTFKGQACQHKVLPFGLSLSPCVSTEVTEAALVPLRDKGIRTLNYLDDWLILAQSQDQLCEHRDLVLTPQPVGPSGQPGKEQTLPDAEDLFSWYRVGFGRTDDTPHAGTCPVGVELLEYVQEQDGGPTEMVSEAPGVYGSYSGSHATGAASY
ncbi:hypothetical protein M9458_057440 [Cirrhinus mrigala]|uniref:ribonuclease H n=1 Tax=Cirrhinus mrigala TaxID=683832 RepID=A0ABD0MBB8_CIRMR